MKRRWRLLALLAFGWAGPGLLGAESATAEEGVGAFRGAEGWGASARGGRGGRVVRVTSLANEGEGSLRAALEAPGPKIVVLEVAGVVDLEDEIRVSGETTLAGQTAPGDGLEVRGARLVVVGDDVVIRGMTLRPGGGEGQHLPARDAISVGEDGRVVRRVIVDRNSFTRAPDENAATWGAVEDVTFSNNIIAEGLSFDEPKLHSFGLLVGRGARRVSILGNLLAGNDHRNPQVRAGAREVEVAGNLIFDWGPNGLQVDAEAEEVTLVGNVFAPGPNTVDRAPIRITDEAGNAGALVGTVAHDNVERRGGRVSPARVFGWVMMEPVERLPSGTPAPRSERVREAVLATAGPARRSAGDHTIVEAARRGVGLGARRTRGSVEGEGADPPALRSVERDCDGDGMIDRIEAGLGFDVSRDDSRAAHEGRTRIEAYLDHLIAVPPEIAAWPVETPLRPRLIEFEEVPTREGLAPRRNPNASAGGFLETDGKTPARIDLTFSGPPGPYRVSVGYFGESDGASRTEVLLDGEAVDVWTWDAAQFGPAADSGAKAERVVEGIWLTPGQTISIAGTADGGEPMRLDFLRFEPGDWAPCEARAGLGDAPRG